LEAKEEINCRMEMVAQDIKTNIAEELGKIELRTHNDPPQANSSTNVGLDSVFAVEASGRMLSVMESEGTIEDVLSLNSRINMNIARNSEIMERPLKEIRNICSPMENHINDNIQSL
jgi:hypothetical protein